MTTAERKAEIRRELAAAVTDARSTADLFGEFLDDGQAPADIAEAAWDLYLKVGRVAGFATMLARWG